MDPHRKRFVNRVPGTQPPAHHQAPAAPAAPAAQPKSKKVGVFTGRRWIWAVVAVLIVIIAGLTFEYIHTKNQLNAAKNPAQAGKTEAEKIINTINGTVQLPTDETPTLATVNDISKLKTQQFFKNAQNGDKVLVYTKSGLAVIYRPSTKKVIIYSFVNTSGTNQ